MVNSLIELESECLKLVAKKIREEHYVRPFRRIQNFVEPDFTLVHSSTSSYTSEAPPPAHPILSSKVVLHVGRRISH